MHNNNKNFLIKIYSFLSPHTHKLKERAKKQRNYEYQLLQNKLEHSEKARRIEWWKDRNSPVIKPYSVSVSVFAHRKKGGCVLFFFFLN